VKILHNVNINNNKDTRNDTADGRKIIPKNNTDPDVVDAL
jgi:hypothetical protein